MRPKLTKVDAGINMSCTNEKAIKIKWASNDLVEITTDCSTCDFSCGYAGMQKKRSKIFAIRPPQINSGKEMR